MGYSVLGPDDDANDGPMYRTDKVYTKGSSGAMMAQAKANVVRFGMRPADEPEERVCRRRTDDAGPRSACLTRTTLAATR